MIREPVIIHIINPQTPVCSDSLSGIERERARSFRFERDAQHWAACRSAIRHILGRILGIPAAEVPIVYNPLGKPLLAAPWESMHFNLSHCHDLALLATCSGGPVGIDVEPLARAEQLRECESMFCHPEEIRSLPHDLGLRSRRLLELWTAKESLLKAEGTGLTRPPETICLQIGDAVSISADETRPPELGDFRIQKLQHPRLEGHVAALSALTSEFEFILAE